ncbi:hypothetical protein DAKH74_032330 [Maudiozyma humilis]|uniref:Uncharacterized protein n=1 Tax=Maudiozyma humilis TaxID=51915 RepID=A0AAV5S0Y9_MAUHU|nr:hypothetical protein DAKH74_032330 [Kazachstania humilis]
MPFSTKRSFTDFMTGRSFQGEQGHASDLNADVGAIPRNSSFKMMRSGKSAFSHSNRDNRLMNNYLDSKVRSVSSLALSATATGTENENETVTSANEDDYAFNVDVDTANYRINALSLGKRRNTASRPGSFSSSKRNVVPKQDLLARERCFDYIIQAIDEAWAMYCNTTSSAEAQVYDNMDRSHSRRFSRSNSSASYNSRLSSRTSDEEQTEYSDEEQQQPADAHTASTVRFSMKFGCNDGLSDNDNDDDDETTGSIDTSGYKSETTTVPGYETDSSDCRTISELPDCMKFQSLKTRLTNAKNDLEESYDSTDYHDCVAFWNRWDMIKYSAVEIMEDDDDDEVIEAALEELEQGRCFFE